MFGDYSQDLLRTGIIELKAGNRPSARRYLDRCLYMSSDHDVMAEAWYWLSQTTDDALEKRQALENCLANDLHHSRARRLLAVLDGRLKPHEIIDPDDRQPRGSIQDAAAHRFTCARCGGRMVYAPDGHSLVCEYCRRHERVNPDSGTAAENDFVIAMATRRGHSQPWREQVRRCRGCGAEFIRPAAELSFSCPYCNSSHVVEVESTSDLIAPSGILPHTFDQLHAQDLLTAWLRAQRVPCDASGLRLGGVYLPVWTFTLGGGIDYTFETAARANASIPGHPLVQTSTPGKYPVMLTVSVAASRRPSAPFVRLLPDFNLGALRPYDSRYLVAWPAELYDVSMAEASLEARSQAYAYLQHELPIQLAPTRVLSTSSVGLMVESFRLDLLPVWICEIHQEGRAGLLLISGQTGAIAGEGIKPGPKARRGLREQLGDLLTG